MQKRVKLGIIGCGMIVDMKFTKAIQAVPDVEMVAVCDVVEEKAKACAEKFGVSAVFTDYNQMLAVPEIDAVLVTTPHQYHCSPVIACAKAGKHVLVEKPMAIDLAEVDAMIAAAQENNVKLMVLPFFESAAFLKCKELIANGWIGTVSSAETFTANQQYPPFPWFLLKSAVLGSLGDIGIYNLSACMGLMGPAASVSAMTAMTAPTAVIPDGRECPLEVEDKCQATLKFADGRMAGITSGWAHGVGRAMMTVYGHAGSFILNGWGSDTLLYRPKDKTKNPGRIEGLPVVKFLNEEWFEVLQSPKNMAVATIDYLVDCIRNDRDMTETLKMNRHVMEIILKSYESAANDGKAVALETTYSVQD